MAADERRDERLPNIRVTAAERAYVEEQAARGGIPLVEFCRRVILSRRVKNPAPAGAGVVLAKVDRAVLDELHRIGVNLNQIARRVNAGRDVPPDFAQTMALLDGALHKVLGDGS